MANDLSGDLTKRDATLWKATAAILQSGREQFTRAFWWFGREGYENDDQRTALLFEFMTRVETHTIEFGNPAVVASEAGVQSFAYDVWHRIWRKREAKRNDPITMAPRAIVNYWRDQVVSGDALRHELVRKLGAAEARKRKDPLLKPHISKGFRFTSGLDGFSFSEDFKTSTLGDTRVTWRFTLVDADLRISAMITKGDGGEPLLPCAFDDPRIRLPEVSKAGHLDRTARLFADAFLDTGLASFKDTVATVLVRAEPARRRGAGFIKTGLALAIASAIVYGIVAFSVGRVTAKAAAASTLFLLETHCVRHKEILLIRGVTTSQNLRYTVVRDGVVLGDATNYVHINMTAPTSEMPNVPLGINYPEGLRYEDRDVMPNGRYTYQIVVHHPRFPFMTYGGRKLDVTVRQCP